MRIIFISFVIMTLSLAQAESISIKELMEAERELNAAEPKIIDLVPEASTNSQKNPEQIVKDKASEEAYHIMKINAFFSQVQTDYRAKGANYNFVMLDKKILFSKINSNIEQISPKITLFRAFTLFKMERMEQIFAEINIYLKETYGEPKPAFPFESGGKINNEQ